MVKHGRNKQSKHTSSTCLALQVVFGRACGAASTTFQIETPKNPTSNKDSETSPKDRPNHLKSNPKMTPKWRQKWSQNRPRKPPDNETQSEIEFDDFTMILDLQNGSKNDPKIIKKRILAPFFAIQKNMIFQVLFFRVFWASKEVPDPQNQAKTQ